jgi:hypothetical protein
MYSHGSSMTMPPHVSESESEKPMDAGSDPAPADTAPADAEPADAEPDAAPADAEPDAAPADGGPDAAPSARKISRSRLVLVDAVIVVASVLAVVGILAVWANRLVFSPDAWSNTSTQLLQDPNIRGATANYLVDQLYANVDIAGLIKSGLPTRLQPLAGPAAGALRDPAVSAVNLALERPRIQSLWRQANRAADQSLIAVVNGGKGPVGVKSGVVTLDLASIVDELASRLGLPADIASKLPPSIANLTVLKSNQIKTVQDVGNGVKSLALWLTIIVPLLWVLAIVLARGHRRRTLMSVGFSMVIVGVIGIAGRSILKSQITNSLVSDASLRPAVHAVLDIGTQILGDIAGAFVLVGTVVIAAAWFAGPARPAVAGRRALAPFLRDHPVWAFAAVAAVMLVIFVWEPIHATGTPVGIVVFLALALLGTEVLRRQTEVEFPGARAGETTAAMRTRVESLKEGVRRDRAPSTQAESVPDQLERLATLRDNGSITPEEYEAAKANVLKNA